MESALGGISFFLGFIRETAYRILELVIGVTKMTTMR